MSQSKCHEIVTNTLNKKHKLHTNINDKQTTQLNAERYQNIQQSNLLLNKLIHCSN